MAILKKMRKLLCKILIVFCLVNVSCKGNVEDKNLKECELFRIGNYQFYSPKVYDRPIVFEKGNHDLLNDNYVPDWYPGYCAVNLPSYFSSKEEYFKYVPAKNIEKNGITRYERFYEANKDNKMGRNDFYHKDYHLLFRGTINVQNLNSGNEYLLVAGKSYIEDHNDYDKNTEFYEKNVNDMIAFIKEDGVYKSVNINLVVGTFDKLEHDKVFDILNPDILISSNAACTESINNLKLPNFNSKELPKWVFNKSKVESDN